MTISRSRWLDTYALSLSFDGDPERIGSAARSRLRRVGDAWPEIDVADERAVLEVRRP